MTTRFNTLIKIVITIFDTLIKIVIVESALLAVNKVIINIIANNVIANIVTILLKTRLV